MPVRPPKHLPYGPRRSAETDTRGSAASRGYDGRWRKLRAIHLQAHPLCVFHQTRGEVVLGNVVDHIRPHKGDQRLLLDPNNLQTLCKSCHDSTKQRMEKRGVRQVGVDGMPLPQGGGG